MIDASFHTGKIYTHVNPNLFFIFHRTFNVVGFDFAQRLLQ